MSDEISTEPYEPVGDDYEALVGSIAIAWNRLEREMDRLLFVYMREEVDVFDRIIASIGNVTKGDLLMFLCKKRERNIRIREHIDHFVYTFNILRENRNILQHAVPHLALDGVYLDRIIKISRTGEIQEFSATIKDLETLRHDIPRIGGYGRLLLATVQDERYRDRRRKPKKPENTKDPMFKPTSFRKLVASLDKPHAPRKLNPIRPPKDPPTD